MFVKTHNFKARDLDLFRTLQQTSFDILESTAATLKAGQTEKEVAKQLFRQYRDAGANAFFHLPVVLFGERTALPGDWPVTSFYPRDRELREGDSVILDAAPLFDGYLVDTSYSFCFGENEQHRQMMQHLAGYRESVLSAVNEGKTFKAIADDVANQMQEAGYEPVHTKHPGEVLGHRTVKASRLPFTWRIKGFDGMSLGWFLLQGKKVKTGLSKKPPTWNSSPASNHKPHDGLWLVEPHAGLGQVGAKWEEILVIENGKARWLDDDVPHAWQWSQIDSTEGYAPRTI